jgi:DNA repair exonuclease SbcCD ATPase subunit
MTNTPVIKKQVEVMEPNPAQENLVIIEHNKPEKDRLEHIVSTKNKLVQMKTDLNRMIDAMTKNPSILSRAALFWNEIPLWQKITGGIVLTVPLLMIGLMANLAALITLSIVTMIVYTVSDILLDNHQSQNTDNTEQLKAGISSLAELLDTVISCLEILREQLAIEIDAFQQENARLTENINQFGEQIKSLTSQIEDLVNTEKKLRGTQVALENTTVALKGSIKEQSELLEKTQKELEQVVQDYKENQTQLSDKINELDEIKVKMGKELDQARSIGLVLRSTVETLSRTVIANKEQRDAFQLRLNEFLTNKEKSFDQVAERICEAERKLSLVTTQLEQSNQRYQDLLDRQEQQIIRLEQMDEFQSTETISPLISPATVLKKIGLYAFDEPIVHPLDQQFSNTLSTEITVH